MKFEVEAHLGLKSDLPRLSFKHPRGDYEIHLENRDMRPGIATPLLSTYIIFDAEDIDAAAELGDRHLDGFLDVLGFCTGARFRIHQRISLFDWDPAVSERHGRVYRSYPDHNVPALVLDDTLVPALETFLAADTDEPLHRSLRWFSSGVAASRPEWQFQLFWFAIETLAQGSRDGTEVPDRCCRCREPLFCAICNEIPTHRPYPTQAIEQLFQTHVSGDSERLFLAATAMRHALLHGDRVADVEARTGVTLSQLVNLTGKVAWVALFRAQQRVGDPAGAGATIRVIQPTNFLHYKLESVGFFSFNSPAGREPDIGDLPNIEMELIVGSESDP